MIYIEYIINAKGLKFEQDFLSKCMRESKLPFMYFNNFHVAYHIDTYKFGQYLKDSLLKNNRVTHRGYCR